MVFEKEILNKYNMVTLDEYKAMFENEEGVELTFYQTFLIQTDHIPNKIIETLVEDLASATLLNLLEVFFNFISSIKKDYNDILQYRKFARQEINRLSAESENA